MSKKIKFFHFLSYLALRTLLYPFSLLPYSLLHKTGEKLGSLLFFLIPKYRKRIFSNLSLATSLPLKASELKPLAQKILGNLCITCLEYAKLSKEKNITKLVCCQNPSEATHLLSQGKGLIFLCAHQANWELFFLEGTSRMPGVAIGQPIKNTYIYNWVLKIREKFGGKIVLPTQAVKEGLRALKQGKFLGIVGDQGMPNSGFSSDFLGRPAWTSPLPALLSYRSGAPLITAIMTREKGSYEIRYSDPIFPNQNEPAEKEVPRLMKQALTYLEDSIKQKPSEWLWTHNRWKQQTRGSLKKPYCQDAIAILLPQQRSLWEKIVCDLSSFKELYPRELLVVFTPYPLSFSWEGEVIPYKTYDDLKVLDYRFKLLFNFTGEKKLSKHFLSLSVLKAADLRTLSLESGLPLNSPFCKLLKGAILHAC